jgi:hypothetical protein
MIVASGTIASHTIIVIVKVINPPDDIVGIRRLTGSLKLEFTIPVLAYASDLAGGRRNGDGRIDNTVTTSVLEAPLWQRGAV